MLQTTRILHALFRHSPALVKHRPRRPAPPLAERRRKRGGETFLSVGPQKSGDREATAVRDQDLALDAEILVHDAVEPHPYRIVRPFAHRAALADLAHG